MTNDSMTLAGLGLITLGFTPTPDDITIISPALQILAGSVLVGLGLLTGGKK